MKKDVCLGKSTTFKSTIKIRNVSPPRFRINGHVERDVITPTTKIAIPVYLKYIHVIRGIK